MSIVTDTVTDTISVLIADDHTLVRESIARQLAAHEDIDVLAQVASAEEAWHDCLEKRPDVVLLDIDMPGQSSFEVARLVEQRLPETRVIFLSAYAHDRYIEQAIVARAAGYMVKTEPVSQLVDAVRRVAGGGHYYSRDVLKRVVLDHEGASLLDNGRSLVSSLTAREMETLRLIARGLSKKEAAEILHISVKTVENHTTSLMNKLNIHDRVLLARFAIREGLAEA